MASTVSELLVKISPSGIKKTNQELAENRQQFEDTADTAKEQSGVLEKFSSKWQGAMQTIAIGLAVAAAGLLSQVPVLGELFAGLKAIVQSVAFQMDSVLRPVLAPITQGFFDLANQIAEAEGPWGTLIGIIGTAIAVIGTIVGVIAVLTPVISAVVGAVGTFIGGLTTIISVIGTVIGVIGTIIATIGLLPVIIIAAIIAAIAIIWLFRDEIWNAITSAAAIIMDFARNAWEWIKTMASNLLSTAAELARGFIGWVRELAIGAVNMFTQLFGTVINAYLSFVRTVLQTAVKFAGAFIRSVQKLANAVRTGFETLFEFVVNGAKIMANRMVSIIEDAVNNIISAIPGFVRTQLGIETVNLGTPFETKSTGEILADANRRLARRNRNVTSGVNVSERNQQIDQLIAAMQTATQENILELDGREVFRSVENLIGDGAVKSGATGVRR